MRYFIFTFLALIMLLPAASANLQDGLIAYYKYENSLNDSSGNNNDATNVNVNFSSSGGIDGAYGIFDGSTSYGDTGVSLDYKPSADFSITSKVYIDDTSETGFAIAGYCISGGQDILLMQYADSKNAFQGRTRSGADIPAVANNISVQNNTWYDVAVTGNSSSDELKIYIDGKLEATNSTASVSPVTGPSIYLGQCNDAGSPENNAYFLGRLDDTRLYNRTLNSNEVGQLSNTTGLFISATDSLTGNDILNFSVSFENGTTASTQNGSIIFPNWADGNYTATLSAQNYISQTKDFEYINVYFINYEMLLNNRINFTFRDEQTDEKISNISYFVVNDDIAPEGNTTSGALNLTGLTDGFYELRYDAEGYQERSYNFVIPFTQNVQTEQILYLLNETQGNFYLPVIQDENENTIQNLIFEAYRWYPTGPNSGTYRLVENTQTSNQGVGTLFLEYNTVGYIFRAYQNNTLLQEYLQPKFIFNQEEFFTVITGESLVSSQIIEGLTYNLSFVNGTTNEFFRLSFDDTANNFGDVCLEVSYRLGVTENISKSCSSANSGVLTFTINSTENPGFYRSIATAKSNDGVDILLEQVDKNFPTREFPASLEGVAIIMVVLQGLFALFLFPTQPILGLSMLTLSILVFGGSLLAVGSLVPIISVFTGAILIITIVLAFVFRGR